MELLRTSGGKSARIYITFNHKAALIVMHLYSICRHLRILYKSVVDLWRTVLVTIAILPRLSADCECVAREMKPIQCHCQSVLSSAC